MSENIIVKKSDRNAALKKTAGQMGLCATLCLVLITAFFAAFAAVMIKVDLPRDALAPITTVLTSLATALSGFMAAKIRKRNGMTGGLIIGLLVFFFVLVAYLITGNDALTLQTIYKLIAFVASGGIGGYAGVSSNEAAKRRKMAVKR